MPGVIIIEALAQASGILGFKTMNTVKDAVADLKVAFEKKLLPNSFKDERYFNIKRMQSIKLI